MGGSASSHRVPRSRDLHSPGAGYRYFSTWRCSPPAWFTSWRTSRAQLRNGSGAFFEPGRVHHSLRLLGDSGHRPGRYDDFAAARRGIPARAGRRESDQPTRAADISRPVRALPAYRGRFLPGALVSQYQFHLAHANGRDGRIHDRYLALRIFLRAGLHGRPGALLVCRSVPVSPARTRWSRAVTCGSM